MIRELVAAVGFIAEDLGEDKAEQIRESLESGDAERMLATWSDIQDFAEQYLGAFNDALSELPDAETLAAAIDESAGVYTA